MLVSVFGFLILGGDHPIVVDTGFLLTEIMKRVGMVGHQSTSRRHEKAAIKRLLNMSEILLPAHDRGAAIKNAEVTGRWNGNIPDGHLDALEPRPWFPVCRSC